MWLMQCFNATITLGTCSLGPMESFCAKKKHLIFYPKLDFSGPVAYRKSGGVAIRHCRVYYLFTVRKRAPEDMMFANDVVLCGKGKTGCTLPSRKYPDTFEFGCEFAARKVLFTNIKSPPLNFT